MPDGRTIHTPPITIDPLRVGAYRGVLVYIKALTPKHRADIEDIRVVVMPKTELAEIEHAEEIFGFLHQSHVSAKNLDRLRSLQMSTNSRISDLASTALEVATVTPFKKRRLLVLAKKRPVLMKKLEDTGLIFAHHIEWEANNGDDYG